jgi:hypothetical protein
LFKTLRNAELIPALNGAHSEAQFWSFVEIGVVCEWFYLSLIEETEKELHQSFVLVPSIPLLLDLLNTACENAWIEAIYLITPESLNGSGMWKMEPLISLTEFEQDDGDCLGHYFVVGNGSSYSTLAKQATMPGRETTLFYAPVDLGKKN